MKALVVKGMCEGASASRLGRSIRRKARQDRRGHRAAGEAGKRGGIYDSHQRDEGGAGTVGIEASVHELWISKEANLPGHFAHLKDLGCRPGARPRRSSP